MNRDEFLAIAESLMRHPTAPYHEHEVREAVEQFLNREELIFKRDRFGNVLAHLNTAGNVRPMVLAAHMDHPGFEIVSRVSDTKWIVGFRGGVGPEYFRPGTPVRVIPGATPARLGAATGREKEFEMEILAERDPGVDPQFAVWDMVDFVVTEGIISGRGCDDVIGVACILAAMKKLKTSGAPVNVIGMLSRAEEVGFHGALCCASEKGLPEESLVVSLETSRELPGAKMNNGVILRVGDKASVFDSKAMRFLAEVASDKAATDRSFHFQRALMSGGTCEATAYQEFGYQVGAVCIALGNYHNCGPDSVIQPEYVAAEDALSMIDLLAEAAVRMPEFPALATRLNTRLDGLLREASEALPRSA